MLSSLVIQDWNIPKIFKKVKYVLCLAAGIDRKHAFAPYKISCLYQHLYFRIKCYVLIKWL